MRHISLYTYIVCRCLKSPVLMISDVEWDIVLHYTCFNWATFLQKSGSRGRQRSTRVSGVVFGQTLGGVLAPEHRQLVSHRPVQSPACSRLQPAETQRQSEVCCLVSSRATEVRVEEKNLYLILLSTWGVVSKKHLSEISLSDTANKNWTLWVHVVGGLLN